MIKQIEHTGKIKVRELKKEVTPVIIFEDEFGLISAFIEYDSKYILLMKTPNGDFVHNISISYLAHEVLQSLDRPDRKRHEELKKHEDNPDWLYLHTYRWGYLVDPDTKEVIIQSFPIFIDPDVAYSE